jgi:hypothetical protein
MSHFDGLGLGRRRVVLDRQFNRCNGLKCLGSRHGAHTIGGQVLADDLAHMESIDIYKQIRFLKDVLHMENMKQKSVERFLGIHRLDKYSGGDLIKVYQEYVKLPVKTNKQLLLQHNYEDLEGLLDCTSMLAYCKFKAGCLLVRKMSSSHSSVLMLKSIVLDALE